MRKGRKSAAQTKAPVKDRIKGSKVNKIGSASSRTRASSIVLSDEIIKSLTEKVDDFNKQNPDNKVTLNDLKAVFRRGAGAFSTSHRPNMTRNGWAYARVNKFLDKKAGEKVKDSYVQDDDLMEKGGDLSNKYIQIQYPFDDNRKSNHLFSDLKTKSDNRIGDDELLIVSDNLEEVVKKEDWDKFLKEKSIENFPTIGLYKYITLSDEEKKEWHWRAVKNHFSFTQPKNWKIIEGKVSEDPLGLGYDKMAKGGLTTEDNGLMASIYPEVKEIFANNGLILNEDYSFTDGSNKSYLPYTGMYKTEGTINKVGITYYQDAFEVLGELEVEVDEDGKIEVEVEFPNWNINEEIEIYEKGGKTHKNVEMNLTESLTVSDIDKKYPNVSHLFINKQLMNGIKIEMEHTNDPEVAKKIALDHLNESIYYYQELEKMEKRLEKMDVDEHFAEINKKFEDGGEIEEIFVFETPTGERSKLTYLQQVLVRTSAFKNWFGDWELAARRFVKDNKENFEKHFQEVSKVIDYQTLEPRVVFHGTKSKEEFYTFDVTREKGVGRPYAYFAYNKEYAQNFTTTSQRGESGSKPFFYECFLNVKKPFMALGHDFVNKDKDSQGWLMAIIGQILWDKYRRIERDDFSKALETTVDSQIGRYLKSVYPQDSRNKFWKLMAADSQKDFKFFLIAYGYDGVFYTEEFSSNYDVDNPSQFTQAVTIFDARQVKLADTRNTQFDPFIDDVRFEKGGHTTENHSKNIENEHLEHQNEQFMNKLEALEVMMEKGGSVMGDGAHTNDAKKGGFFDGKSHAEGGIKAKNIDTGQIIEVEGNEVIINKKSVADETLREFEGEMLTNRQILSKINEEGGGVSFEDGGEVKYNCNCIGKKYNFGGEMLDEQSIVGKMNEKNPVIESKEYLESIMKNIYI